VINPNARTELIDYQHPYCRTWEEYQDFLRAFGPLPPRQRILDGGGGLGVAATELARLGQTIFVLNAQDLFSANFCGWLMVILISSLCRIRKPAKGKSWNALVPLQGMLSFITKRSDPLLRDHFCVQGDREDACVRMLNE
jgi:hypothetical protein